MFTTLAAVLVALALGHVAPAAAASLRRFYGFRRWLGWLDAHGGKAWQGPAGVALALLPPVSYTPPQAQEPHEHFVCRLYLKTTRTPAQPTAVSAQLIHATEKQLNSPFSM